MGKVDMLFVFCALIACSKMLKVNKLIIGEVKWSIHASVGKFFAVL